MDSSCTQLCSIRPHELLTHCLIDILRKNLHVLQAMYTIIIIASYFRGTKFSRIAQTKHFADFIFEDRDYSIPEVNNDSQIF